MADDPHNTSDISDNVEVGSIKEDAETTAARRELKHTTISDKTGKDTAASSQDDKSASGDEAPADKPTLKASTPESGSPRLDPNYLKEQVSSPKKKRAHDELDEGAQESPKKGVSTVNTTIPVKSRSDRTEPEKKRPRDRQADEEARNSQDEEVMLILSRARQERESNSGTPIGTTIRFFGQVKPRWKARRCAGDERRGDPETQDIDIRIRQLGIWKACIVRYLALWHPRRIVRIDF